MRKLLLVVVPVLVLAVGVYGAWRWWQDMALPAIDR